jgi:insertion element IS1 protein InsB
MQHRGFTAPNFLSVYPKTRLVGPKGHTCEGLFCSLCFKLSGGMECQICKGGCQKAGRQKNGAQKHYCKGCKKYQQEVYQYKAYRWSTDDAICQLICEGVSVRGAARVLNIAVGTVLSRIRLIGKRIRKPAIVLDQREFEVDELRTFIGRKGNEYWLAYALNKESGEVVDFVVGKRSKRTLRMLTNTLLLSGVRRIRTDGLSIYRSLIPKNRHRYGSYCTNHIERKNLTIRTHLKRLSRRTICFSRSLSMLESCLRIYFWRKANFSDRALG